MLLIKYFLLNILFFTNMPDVPKDRSVFKTPIMVPLLLSANFGELRSDHFHSGIDIKTQGVIGKEVVSSASGFIYRISVSPGGFGKALYVKHPGGYSTVYAHLDRFAPEIEEYVRAQQYEKKSFMVTLFFDKEQFPVEQGELIAFSGNSGSSGGPHLHFEVRESDSEFPVNPLLFGFGISDNVAPVIEKLAIYPVSRNSYINKQHSVVRLNVTGANGKYSIPSEKEIIISGDAGFGIKMHDLLDGSNNKCAAYTIQLEIDSAIIFRYAMDGFSFNESRYINSHIDYATYIRESIHIQKTFVQPNDKLSIYSNLVNRGIYSFADNKLHHVVITVCDASNNKSVLSFKVRSATEKPVKATTLREDKDIRIMPYNRANKFVDENVSVTIPNGALYDTLHFAYKKSPGSTGMLSDIYSVHNKYTPVQKAFTLAIKPNRIPAGKESKMFIVQLNENLSKKPTNSVWADGFLKSDVMSFGNYYVGIDTVSPVISAPGLTRGINLTGRKEIRLKITDDFSGIKSYEPSIDGNWALFEYDPKGDVLIYRFDEKRITRGIKHSLSLKVMDNRDNPGFYSLDFTW